MVMKNISDTIIYNQDGKGLDEYVVSVATGLDLKHEEPFYGPDGKFSLVMYPSEEMLDYMEQEKIPSFAISYAEVFVEFEDMGKKICPYISLRSNDESGNDFDLDFKLSKESCDRLYKVIEKDIKRVGFESMEALQKDYARFFVETNKKAEITKYPTVNLKGSKSKPAELDNERG